MDLTRRKALGLALTGLVGAKGASTVAATSSFQDKSRSLRATMARTEHRGFMLPASDLRYGGNLQAGDAPPGLKCTFFRADKAYLPGGNQIADPLTPLAIPDLGNVDGGDLFLRVHVGSETPFGRHRLTMTFDDLDGQRVAVPITIDVVPVALPNLDKLTIQATLWGPGLPAFQGSFDPVRVMQTMRHTDINALALSRGYVKDQDLVRVALDGFGFRSVRLPEHRMFSWRDRLSASDLETNRTLITRWLEDLSWALERPDWRDRLTYKLWDEPVPESYADVAELYRHARAIQPGFKLELTEEPSDDLGNICDIWTVHAEFIDGVPVERRQARGEEVWFYANNLHSLGRSSDAMRQIGWLIWRYRLDGYHFWSMNWWQEDPWAPTATTRAGKHKDGTLLFPSVDRPGDVLTTLRLQAFRDGLQDWRWLRYLDWQANMKGPTSREAALANDLRKRVTWDAAATENLDLWALRRELEGVVLDQI